MVQISSNDLYLNYFKLLIIAALFFQSLNHQIKGLNNKRHTENRWPLNFSNDHRPGSGHPEARSRPFATQVEAR